MLLVLLTSFFVLVALGFPVAFGLGISTTFVMWITDAPLGILPMRLWSGIDKFAWVAIPLFMLAGELMGTGGILQRLLDFARMCVGRLKGGLLHVNIFVSMLFGGINGSGPADTSAVGSLLIPATVAEYKDSPLAAAVTACSSMVGPIIPPSLPMIIYALVSQTVTISGMFLAGVVPGILLGVGMMGATALIVKKRGFPRDETKYSTKDVLRICRRFTLAMVLPLIMVGGVVSGIFTATESAGVAVIYALIVGLLVTRELNFQKIFVAVINAAKMTGVIMIMVGIANIGIWWLSTQQLATQLSELIQSLTNSPIILLCIVAIMYLVLGIVIDCSALLIMMVPVFTPICLSYGLNPLHVGMVSVLSIMLGLLTPPVSVGLFIASTIARTPLEQVFKSSLPLLAVCVATLFIIIFFPESCLWVPKLFGYVE